MLFGTFIHILTSLIRDFCTSDRNFASTFFQIPPHDGHPWSWLVVGHCDYNPHNRLSLSRYMPCPAYQEKAKQKLFRPLLLTNLNLHLVFQSLFYTNRNYLSYNDSSFHFLHHHDLHIQIRSVYAFHQFPQKLSQCIPTLYIPLG